MSLLAHGRAVRPSVTSTSYAVAPSQVRPRARTALRVEAAKVQSMGCGSWVVSPSNIAIRPKGVVHFLGGAFAGAAPQVLYSLFLELVADAGYTVVATPFAVTFQHKICAQAVRQQFLDTLTELRQVGQGQLVPTDVPVFGMGHSNGALLHMLMGCYYPGSVTGNVIISFNNKPVADAIPVPGFLSTLSPSVKAARAAQLPFELPSAKDLLAATMAFLPPAAAQQLDDAGQISRAALALDQLGSVFGEVGDGVTDFTPSPAESRLIIGQDYSIPSTLLIKFYDDTIDETADIEQLLKLKYPRGTVKLTLRGSHVTPCGGDLKWQSGPVFTPVDAVVQIAKAQQQADLRGMSRQVVQWLDSHR